MTDLHNFMQRMLAPYTPEFRSPGLDEGWVGGSVGFGMGGGGGTAAILLQTFNYVYASCSETDL